MQICCSTCSVILNDTATQYACSLNGIYHPSSFHRFSQHLLYATHCSKWLGWLNELDRQNPPSSQNLHSSLGGGHCVAELCSWPLGTTSPPKGLVKSLIFLSQIDKTKLQTIWGKQKNEGRIRRKRPLFSEYHLHAFYMCIHIYIHTYIHTHIYIHTYIYIYIYINLHKTLWGRYTIYW